MIIPVPAAEPAVGRFRSRFDRAAADGIPAHVTLLYPFAPFTDEAVPAMTALFSNIVEFDFSLSSLKWFGESVLYLAPSSPAPFLRIIDRLTKTFPDWPPYGGQFESVVPHLTIGESGSYEELSAAAIAIAPSLPIACRAAEVQWWEGKVGSPWSLRATFRLTKVTDAKEP